MTSDKLFVVLRAVAGGVAIVGAALWTAVQTGLIHYGPRFTTIVGSVAIGGAALMPSLLPRPSVQPKP